MSKIFLKTLEKDRIDCEYYDPKYDFLKNLKKSKYSLIDLKNVATPLMGKTPAKSEYSQDGIPIIKFGSLTGNGINWKKVERAKTTFYVKNKKRTIQEGDIIITSSAHNPEYIGKKIDLIRSIPNEFDKVLFVGELMVVRPNKDKIIPEYLYYYLKSEFGRLQIRQEITGQTAHLYPTDVGNMKVVLPKDKKIQEKIIQPIKRSVDLRINNLKNEELKLKEFDTNIIKMLGLNLLEFKKEKIYLTHLNYDRIDVLFNSKYFKKLVETIKSTPHKKLSELVDEKITSKPVSAECYEVIDLRKINDTTGMVKPIKTRKLNSAKISLIKDTLIINKLSPTKRKTIIIDEKLSKCVASTEFMVIKPKNKNDLKYLLTILRSEPIILQWYFQITGSNPSRERIHKSLVLNTLIPFPKEKRRKEISKLYVEIIKSVVDAQDNLKKELKESLDKFVINLIT